MGDMNKRPSIKKNFFYSTVYQVFNLITPIITAPYISRVLGAEGIGIQSFTASNQAIFLMFAALGTMSYGAREISMNRDNPIKRSMLFWEIELMSVVTSLLALIVWFFFIGMSEKNQIYYEVLTIGFLTSLFDITWFFNGLEQFKLTVLRNLIFRIISLVCLFLFIRGPEDLLLYILLTSLTGLMSSLSLWPYLRRFLVKVNICELRFTRHFHETIIYFIPTIASSVYTVLDRTLIGVITKDMYENGYYQQADRIISISKILVYSSLNSVMGVRISYLYSEKKFDEIHSRIENSMNYMFFMGFGACCGIAGIAQTFIPLFLGPGYDKVIPLLYILSPILVIIGISNCLGHQYYTPCGKRAQSAKYIIAGALVNLIMNIILIPVYASLGAAVASIMAEVVVTVLYVKNSEDYGKISMLYRAGNKKLLAGCLMLIVIYCFNRFPWNSLLIVTTQIACGAVIYILCLLILQDRWTKEIFSRMLHRIIR